MDCPRGRKESVHDWATFTLTYIFWSRNLTSGNLSDRNKSAAIHYRIVVTISSKQTANKQIKPKFKNKIKKKEWRG